MKPGSRPSPGRVVFATTGTVLTLAACHHSPAANATLAEVQRNGAAPVTAGEDDRIACATGAGAFMPSCTVSRERTPAGLVLTVQRADGGFRRLLVTRDGGDVVAADGAQAARVSIVSPDQIEVALGGDRYRLPAKIRAVAR